MQDAEHSLESASSDPTPPPSVNTDLREEQKEDAPHEKRLQPGEPIAKTQQPPSNLTVSQRQRLKTQHDNLQSQWNLKHEMLERLQNHHVIETDIAYKFKLEKQIQHEKVQLALLGDELEKIEQALSCKEDFSNAQISSVQEPRLNTPTKPEPPPSSIISSSSTGSREDWGDAPAVSLLFGRDDELKTLKQWILEERCSLVAIIGMAGAGKSYVVASLNRGGTGKTDLSVKLAKDIRKKFKYVFWQKLLTPLQPAEYLSKLISFLSEGWETQLPETLDRQIKRLLYYLNKHRCLLILDNFDTVMQGGNNAGQYRRDYEGYGQILEKVGTVQHQSCLLLTSREKPREMEALAGKAKPVRFFDLGGVDYLAAKQIFNIIDSGFSGSDAEWKKLTEFLRGNVLALELAARHIKKVFGGNISSFNSQDRKVSEEIRQQLLDWHFERLLPREQEIVYWLAINREPVVINDLERDIVSSEARKQVSSTLELIERSLPIEYSNNQTYTLQPVLIEDATRRLVERVIEEIKTNKISLIDNFAIVKAITKEYVRDIQKQLIIQPIIDGLTDSFENHENVKVRLNQLLSIWQQEHPRKSGYLAGNILNLLRQMGSDLTDYDFSNLTIRQAYLEDAILHGVNFTNSDLTDSAFADHFGTIFSVTFSHDRNLLAGCGDDGLIRLWQEADWEPLAIYEGHTDFIRTLTFNREGTKLASAGDDRTLFLWDVDTKDYMIKPFAHSRWIQSMDFSPDGSRLASCGGDCLVKLWDVETLDECLQTFEGHTAGVMTVRFSPDGKTLASGGRDSTVKLWNVETGSCIATLTDHKDWIYSVSFSPDGKTLASGSRDQTVKLWNLETYECINTLKRHKNQVWSVAFCPDGKTLASAGDDGIGILWNVQTSEVRHVLKGHESAVGRVSFNRNGSILASCSSDCKVRLWDVRTGQCIKVLYGHASPVWTLAYSPDGKFLASSGKKFAVTLWNMETGQSIQDRSGHEGWVLTVAFSPNGNFLASGSEDHTVKLWNLRTSECITLQGHDCRLETVTFSPDGRTLASAGHDYQINLWDVSSKIWRTRKIKPFKTLLESDRVFSVKFNSTGSLLVSGGADSVPKLWDVDTSKRLREFQGHTDQVWTVAFSPDDKILATGSDDCTVRLWNVETGECLNTLEGHDDWIWSVAFNPDGTLLASAGGDRTIKIWDIRSGKSLETLEGHESWVWRVAFSPDGVTLASGSSDETVKIWDIQEIGVVQKDRCIKTLKDEGPYNGMNITGAKGLTDAEKKALKLLGAIED